MSRALPHRPEPHPRYVVWELTLKCDLACRHCGSRAGRPRDEELTIDEAVDVVHQLAQMGTYELSFIGGEAYLYRGWLEVVRAAATAGIRCSMTTGGRQVGAELARRAAEAGMRGMSVSVDGTREVHDHLRNLKGSHAAAMAALGHVRDAGMTPMANTQVNRDNLPILEALADELAEAGIRGWQVQLTGPMGRAADTPERLLQPYDLLELVPRLAAIAESLRGRGIEVEAANNLGYFGPFEHVLRRAHWKGCHAGQYLLGLEANGDVKGCPSLPSGPYVGGNLRRQPLAEVWAASPQLRFTRDRDLDELWGFCKGCYYAETCRGGCSWTSHTLLGRRGNMPWCHHRAETLAASGRRERLVQVERAPGEPFDFGRFELVEEDIP